MERVNFNDKKIVEILQTGDTTTIEFAIIEGKCFSIWKMPKRQGLFNKLEYVQEIISGLTDLDNSTRWQNVPSINWSNRKVYKTIQTGNKTRLEIASIDDCVGVIKTFYFNETNQEWRFTAKAISFAGRITPHIIEAFRKMEAMTNAR